MLEYNEPVTVYRINFVLYIIILLYNIYIIIIITCKYLLIKPFWSWSTIRLPSSSRIEIEKI